MAKNMFGRDAPLGKKPYALGLLKGCVFAGSVFLAAALRQCWASSRESDSVKNLFHIGASIQPGPAIKRSQCRTAFGLESGLCHKSPGGFAQWMAVLAHFEEACEQAKPQYNDIPVNDRIDFENRESDMWGSKLLSGQSGSSRNAGIRVVGLLAAQGLARCFAVA
ncbi:hypothetical protein [Pseudomonas syringae]|uniref:hypothetical protein n=1 Tax=Pseudomonas syringae TaxID=317 RepID=UPI001F211EF9|nr:hypothetical protein [Pseudomonas syringae]